MFMRKDFPCNEMGPEPASISESADFPCVECQHERADEIAVCNHDSPTPPPPPPLSPPPLPPLPPPVPTSAPAPAVIANPISMRTNFSSDEMTVQQHKPEPPSAPLLVKDDPKFAKYFEMLSMQFPKASVTMKMTVEGVDPSVLELDPNGPSPNQPQSALDPGHPRRKGSFVPLSRGLYFERP